MNEARGEATHGDRVQADQAMANRDAEAAVMVFARAGQSPVKTPFQWFDSKALVVLVTAPGERFETGKVDLDGLKGVNDRKGHDAGDNAIRAVARTLEKSCRATDLAARFGGDEFAVLLPNISQEEALTLAERIRKSLGMEASWVAPDLPPLTLSIGIADTTSIPELHPDRLYSAADRALYPAKQQGKNQCVLASAVEGDAAG